MFKKIIIGMWVVFALAIIGVVIFFVSVFNGAVGYMPNLSQLENPLDRFATQVYSADGKLLGTWSYSNANRIFVSYEEIPQQLVQALVATEDERFYDHCGIDFRAISRAVVKRGIQGQKSAGGGSTLTQQLAKQLYSQKANDDRERVMQKPVEWCIALKLERYYTKEEIITMYLNYFDFLYNAVGIKMAANTYFGKEPMDLSLVECATLVGMCKNPSYYNPKRYPERSKERRNIVLQQMVKSGYITQAQYAEEAAKPLELNFTLMKHSDGQGTYMRDYLRQMLMAKKPERSDYPSWNYQKYYDDSLAWEEDPVYGWCNKNTKRNGEHYDIYEDGLKVYTTLDSRMQQYAEEAVNEWVVQTLQPKFAADIRRSRNAPYNSHMSSADVQRAIARAKRQSSRYADMKRAGCTDEQIEASFNVPVGMTIYTPRGERDTTMTPLDSILYYKGFLRTGFMCMDAKTGHVKAYVGGLDYKHFQYDMCMVGRRQVGSTMKPYLYSLAMENGWYPDDTVRCIRRKYLLPNGGYWSPRNGSTACYGNMVPLTWGLQTSNNWVAAQLMDQLSPAAFVRLLHEFGIKNQSMKASPELCLGTADISVCEMVSAYSVFPMKGVRRHPMLVTRIADSEGNTLAEFRPILHEVISAESSYKMIRLMRGVVDAGTGRRMRSYVSAPMGGKTGTTNDNSDGWFVGYTPELTFGAWVGGEERNIRFSSTAVGQGAYAALPICGKFLKKVYSDSRLGYSQNTQFDIPSDFNVNQRVYDLGSEFYISDDAAETMDAAGFGEDVPIEED